MKDYNLVDWGELLYYDPSSSSGLRWKVDRVNCSGTVVAHKGSVAGAISDKGYWVVPNNKSYYKAHRIVWILNTGRKLFNQIDHVDRDRSNNRFENLREVTHTLNRRNIIKQVNNSTGSTGVLWWESRSACGKYSSTYATAQWNTDGKKQIKRFSVKKYGLLEAFKLACEYRELMINTLNNQGYGYSETHGKGIE